MKLTSKPITLADTALGRHEQTIKRQVNNVIAKILCEEREDLRRKLEEIDKLTEEEHSLSISVMPNLACEKSPSKPDEQPTRDNTEMTSNEGIYEVMCRGINHKSGSNQHKDQLTCIKFPSALLPVMMAAMYQNLHGRNGEIFHKITQI